MKKFLVYIFLLSISHSAISQLNPIGGIMNKYYEVDVVTDDYVDLTAAPGDLQPGDKVILMQMTGVEVLPGGDFPTTNLTWSTFRNGGRFEMLAVRSVSGVRVEFTVTINSAKFSNAEKIQLVKIYEANYATVTSSYPVLAEEWDGTTGGVIALVIFKKLILDDDIIASNAGFPGGQPEPGFIGGCRENTIDTLYFNDSVEGVAGRKGEGIIMVSFGSVYTKGTGSAINGGGGGLGKYAGGAGGAHYGSGGNGGNQKSECTTYKNSIGGLALTASFYGFNSNRVTMGGGGGSSVQDANHSATKGGDGGGIVIIMTDTLENNNNSGIYASGESVGGLATAGAGGGGAGGGILLDVSVFAGPDDLYLDVQGGDGGSTGDSLTGAGGGGGGGIVWYSGTSLPGNVSYNISPGLGGEAEELDLEAIDGDPGSTLANLQLPLNGFLFNTIDGPDTICEGRKPKLIKGSLPRGKSVSYIYEWLQSDDGSSWVTASGTGDMLSFQPDEITNTTYYTRVILDTLTDDPFTPPEKYVYDTAFSLEVFVYPSLMNNTIAIYDTLCSGQSPPYPLTGSDVSGGDGYYSYNWYSGQDGLIDWGNNISSDSILIEGDLFETTYYTRVVTSHRVCVDTSNIDSITVLEPISNNIFFPIADTAICEYTNAGIVKATTPAQLGGGDGTYTFAWMESTDDENYSVIAGAIGTDYPAGVLTDNIYYKRIVYSGSDAVCKDTTSPSFFIEVYNSISNNSITGTATQYVCSSSEKQLTGSSPEGGSGSYAYIWEEWIDGSGWQPAFGDHAHIHFTSPSLTDTISYRRFVSSGQYAQCKDTSFAVLIDINPLPAGDIAGSIDTLCAGDLLAINYSLSGNGPWSMTVGGGNINHTETNISDPEGEFSFAATESASIRVLEIVDDSLCQADETGFVNAVELTAFEVPDADAGDDVETCGLTAALSARPSAGSGLWSGEDVVFDDPTNSNASASVSEYDVYNFVWTETNWNCTDEDEILVTFYEQPQEAIAGEDQDLDYTFNTTLNAQLPDVGVGYWQFATGSGSFEDSTLNNTRVDFPEVGTYELSWTVINGTCDPVSNSILIVVNDLAIFNGFSPNGDGVNDEFILNMSGLNPAKLIILDRWGSVIFETDGTDELIWNGENKKGKIVPVGTYFYVIKEEGLPDRKGYVELRK